MTGQNHVFLVIRDGVYRHEILGVYSTHSAAVERAQEAANTDIDSYHTYEVSRAAVDTPIEDVDMPSHSFSKPR